MNILFDNVNLNSNPYTVTELNHESVAERDVFSYELARERGSIVVSSEYRSKKIAVSGTIRGTSKDDLDSKIDDLKEVLNRAAKNLDIAYSSGTRRYKQCYATVSPIRRGRTDITKAYWDVTFLVPEGVGASTSATTSAVNNITSATYNGSVSITGTAKPKPKFTITIDSVTGTLNSIALQAGDFKIELQETLVAADVVVFNMDEKIVTLNGVSKDFVGQFPSFTPGANAFTITANGTTRQYDLSIEYFPTFL